MFISVNPMLKLHDLQILDRIKWNNYPQNNDEGTTDSASLKFGVGGWRGRGGGERSFRCPICFDQDCSPCKLKCSVSIQFSTVFFSQSLVT